MTRDDVLYMAREAGGEDWGIFRDFMPEIERFAALVAAAERQRIADMLRADSWLYCATMVEGREE